MHLPFDDVRYSPDASCNVSYFFVADVKCGLCEINKNNGANATHGLSPVQKTFRSNVVGPERSRTRTWTCTNTIYAARPDHATFYPISHRHSEGVQVHLQGDVKIFWGGAEFRG